MPPHPTDTPPPDPEPCLFDVDTVAPAVTTRPAATISVHLAQPGDLDALAAAVGQPLHANTRELWYDPATAREGHMPPVPPEGSGHGRRPTPETDLFGMYVERWRNEWLSMPDYHSENISPWRSLRVHFATEADRDHFDRHVSRIYKAKFCWYPPRRYGRFWQKAWLGGPAETRHPLYVISKGRWETPLTANRLEQNGTPYYLVVEPQEAAAYSDVVGDAGTLLVTPFSNLGQGSIPVRNFVWDHAVSLGAPRHWVLDDNMDGLYRFHNNEKRRVRSAAPFVCIEDFVDRYENIAIAGMQYEFFVTRYEKRDPFTPNTRVYSCILIDHRLPHRWRGRYNEDTDLSLRAMKDGWATCLVNAFSVKKMPTMKLAGGNTDELYAGDGRRAMAESLVEQHPDVASVTWKWGRWQHHVDYRPFAGIPYVRRPEAFVDLSPEPNEYGMELRDVEEAEAEEPAVTDEAGVDEDDPDTWGADS